MEYKKRSYEITNRNFSYLLILQCSLTFKNNSEIVTKKVQTELFIEGNDTQIDHSLKSLFVPLLIMYPYIKLCLIVSLNSCFKRNRDF